MINTILGLVYRIMISFISESELVAGSIFVFITLLIITFNSFYTYFGDVEIIYNYFSNLSFLALYNSQNIKTKFNIIQRFLSKWSGFRLTSSKGLVEINLLRRFNFLKVKSK